ncbi:MAG: hypothetical protein ACI8UD_001649 [Planctomycetota bacterium]
MHVHQQHALAMRAGVLCTLLIVTSTWLLRVLAFSNATVVRLGQ